MMSHMYNTNFATREPCGPNHETCMAFKVGAVRLQRRGLILYGAELLHVDGLHHLLAVGDGGFLESLTATQFFNDAGFFKFTFEFLKRSFDEFAFFYLYDDHILMVSFEFAFTLARQN